MKLDSLKINFNWRDIYSVSFTNWWVGIFIFFIFLNISIAIFSIYIYFLAESGGFFVAETGAVETNTEANLFNDSSLIDQGELGATVNFLENKTENFEQTKMNKLKIVDPSY